VAFDDADGRVRVQYEAYPYPHRNPQDERRRLVVGSPSDLDEVNHYVFAGRRSWRRPFRALVAGGGTGDGLILLAQRLAERGVPAEIAYLDVSGASRAIAEARAAVRGLTSIRFVTGSILDAAMLVPGPWDYIDCCGVLHHLAGPEAGLRALRSVLAPDGGLGLMVYGALGRTGVYPVQDLLRGLAGEENPPADRLAVARRLLAALPPTNWLKRNSHVGDHLDGSDAGLYDLLLHGRDRAYTVPEVASLCAAAELRIAAFIEPARYEPATYVADPVLRKRFAAMTFLDRAAAAERLAGNLTKHVFYAVPADRPASVAVADDDAVPILRDERRDSLTADADGLKIRFPLPRLAPAILARIDGRRTLAEIHADLQLANPSLDREPFRLAFESLYAALNGLNKLVLAYPAAES
jgi:SAM-dependent methyltransferase